MTPALEARWRSKFRPLFWPCPSSKLAIFLFDTFSPSPYLKRLLSRRNGANQTRFQIMVNVTVENLAPCKKLVRVDVDAKRVDEAFEAVTSQFQKQVKLPGFRPGKAPKDYILKTYSKELEEETKKKLLGDSYREALKEKQIHPVGNPDVEEIQFGRGQNFQYAVTVETAPEFELPEYKGLPAKRRMGDVTDTDVENALNVLRERHAAFSDVERPVQEGDFVVVDYSGTSEGKPLTEFAPTAMGLTKNENFWVHAKTGAFIPGFPEQLIGLKTGDKKTIELDFPADFVAQPLSGKHAVYEVEVKQVKEKNLPEFNDEFAKKFGVDTLDKLKEGVRHDLSAELSSKIAREVRDQLLRELLGRVNCELPETLLKEATNNAVYDVVYQSQQRGMSKEQIEEQKESIYHFASATANQRLRTSFLLGKIADKEKIKVTPEELSRRLYYMAYERKMDVNKMVKEMQKSGEIQQVQEQALMAKVIDFLEQHAAIEEVQSLPETEGEGQAAGENQEQPKS
jgi:trigger factor